MKKALIICLDVSGSMGSEASTKDNDGGNAIQAVELESHAARTLVMALKQQCNDAYLGVITFDSDVSVIQQPTNKYNEEELCKKLMQIDAGSSTNMWGVIEKSLVMANELINQDFYVDIYLFTDGAPTEKFNPARGILQQLERDMPPKHCSIHTFGFGPDIDSYLLLEISKIGRGLFKYISDPGMVGTCLINSACKFILDKPKRTEKVEVPVIDDILSVFGKTANKFLTEKEMASARELIPKIPSTHPLYQDREQMKIACSQLDFFQTWGVHFFRTLKSSHEYQHCGNFKDTGLQGYTDEDFGKMQDIIEKIFKSIEPPGGKPVNMETYVNPSGGCVRIDDLVKMADETTKPAGQLKRGDEIKSTNGKNGIIEWVSLCEDVNDLISMGDVLHITCWHPIRVNGREEWTFPAKNFSWTNTRISNEQTVVTFGLKDKDTYSFFVGNYECVTLGHEIIDDEVLKHEFYGTNKVIEYLEKLYKEQGGFNGKVYVKYEDLNRLSGKKNEEKELPINALKTEEISY